MLIPIIVSLLLLIPLCVLVILRHVVKRRKLKIANRARNAPSVAFLHPHSLSGGGGERVLWCALQATKAAFPASPIAIHAAWPTITSAVQQAHDKAMAQFGLDISDISFLPVDITDAAKLVKPTNYPRLTLLLQAIGAIALGAEAYWKQPTDMVIDTANLTFALVIPKLLGARTLSYVHYPTISSDMLEVVRTRKAQFNNDAAIASSGWRTALKTGYYRMFAAFYRIAALFVDVKLANSSWTSAHLRKVWGVHVDVVYPPCRVDAGADGEREGGLLVSVGQFRPEKNHALQLDMMEELSRRHGAAGCRLVMLGGARNAQDAARARALREDAERRRLRVEVRVNATRDELRAALATARVGVHTMRDEHFGISVVELQAAGLLVVAHRSGGVAADIVRDGETGLLAGDSAQEYGQAVARALGMPEEEQERMREAARRSCSRFGEDSFRRGFAAALRGEPR